MLTQKDLKKIEEIIDRKLDEKLDEKIKYLPTKDDFSSRMDKLSGEIQAARDEFAAKKYRVDQLEEHEERLDRLDRALELPPLK